MKCLPSIVYRDEKAITIVPHAQPMPTPCIPAAATEIEMSDVYVASYAENPSISLNPVHETQTRALRIQYNTLSSNRSIFTTDHRSLPQPRKCAGLRVGL